MLKKKPRSQWPGTGAKLSGSVFNGEQLPTPSLERTLKRIGNNTVAVNDCARMTENCSKRSPGFNRGTAFAGAKCFRDTDSCNQAAHSPQSGH